MSAIPSAISFELRAPVFGVDLRCTAVFLTAVPETAIDKDRDLGPREDDVRASSHGGKVNSVIAAVPVSEVVQRSAQRQLG